MKTNKTMTFSELIDASRVVEEIMRASLEGNIKDPYDLEIGESLARGVKEEIMRLVDIVKILMEDREQLKFERNALKELCEYLCNQDGILEGDIECTSNHALH